MLIYIIFYIFLFIAAVPSVFIKKKWLGNVVFVIAVGLFLYFISAFKGISVGRDTESYLEIFNRIAATSWTRIGKNGIELGFAFLNKVFSSLKLPFQSMLFVVYALIYVPICFVLCKKSNSILFSFTMILVLLLAFFLSGIRQSIAISFCTLSFYFLSKDSKKDTVISILLILFASLFHVTVLASLLIIPLSFLKFKKNYLIVVLPALLLMFFISNKFYETIYYLFAQNHSYFPGTFGGGGMFFFYFIIMCSIIISFTGINDEERTINIFNVVDNKLQKLINWISRTNLIPINTKTKNIFIWSSVLCTLFFSFMRANQNLPRISFYFLPFVAIGLGESIRKRSSFSFRLLLYLIMFAFFSLYYFVIVLHNNSLDILPYQLFF